jgi:hypothetical protein
VSAFLRDHIDASIRQVIVAHVNSSQICQMFSNGHASLSVIERDTSKTFSLEQDFAIEITPSSVTFRKPLI